MKITQTAKEYLTDWKNLATHAIVGIVLMLVIFVIPVHIHFRISILVSVVFINMYRMRLENSEDTDIREDIDLE
ncbi:MAG: hypothetical protein GF411_03460 [Candidatus Lokiarchaeota archaeon]|nr:hypothetical protein [Candidatus Lokiarchaeota archaeon]